MIRRKEDALAIRRCMNNDSEAFQEILERYKNLIFSFILRMVQNPSDAEDLSQDTFIKAFKNLHSYDSAYPFITWLFKIAHNNTIDFIRIRKPESVSLHDEDNPIEIEDASPSPEKTLDSIFQEAFMEKLLGELPPMYREVLLLRYKENMDLKEIAQVLQTPEGTVKVRLFRGRDILRRKLEALGCQE